MLSNFTGAHFGDARKRKALTLLELLAVVAIIGVLATIGVGTFAKVRERAERVRCMNNMKNIHVALGAYVQQKGHWPQFPVGLERAEKDQWLVREMKTVGLGEEIWKCPTLERTKANDEDPEDRGQIDYGITEFDDKAFTPYKWAGQPWVAEGGNNHGDGALILFPDGSIRTMNQVLGEAAR